MKYNIQYNVVRIRKSKKVVKNKVIQAILRIKKGMEKNQKKIIYC